MKQQITMHNYPNNVTNRIMLLLIMFILSFNNPMHAQGTWIPLTNLAPGLNGGGMLLLSDGTVLAKSFSGGAGQYGNIYNKLTPDIHGSYANGTWSSIAPMHNTRLYYSTQVLKDGRVYAAGGEYGTGGALGEVYNPLTNTWTDCPNPGQTISDANSEILEDGRVLQAVVNGSLRATLIYNPATNTYINGPTALGIHNESVWIKLPDNSILYVNRLATSSERYIPATNTWINDATVPVSLYDPFGLETGAALLLPDGRAFFIGSNGTTAYYTPSGNTTNGSWAAGPMIPGAKGAPDAPAAMMVNGKILLTVSPIPTSANHFPTPTSYYEFNYLNNTFTQINAPGGGLTVNQSCYVTNMLDLPDGNVLYADQGDNQYYVYAPSGTPLVAGKPTISHVTQNSCTQFTIAGTQFNGISQGACYGDDWQMASNYPIIRLTSGTNVYYARSFNWNSTGVMRGTAPDSVQFTLPTSLPAGTYSLVVVANGIASNPITFNPTPMVSFTGLATTYQLGDPAVTLIGTPAGGTFSGPGISGNVFTPANAGAGGPYTVTYTYCTQTATHQTTVGSCPVPTIPTSIIVTGGSAKVCPGETRTYSTALVAGVTYNWTMPTGAVINSGQGTRTIVVSFNSNFIATGVMSVVKVNSCGDSPPRTLSIVKNTPATPGAITGSNFGLCNALNKIYSITAVAGLTYNWTVPAGASITSGQGSNSIHVNFPAGNFSGNIAVSGSNACGAGGIRTLAVKAIPATPAVISGNVNVCANSSGNPFSIIAIASAVNYTWTGPTGSHITGNGITSASNVLTTTAVSVTVAFGTSITTMRVKANNTCASGGTRSLTLIACPARIEPDAAKSIVYPNPSDGLFHLVFNSSANDDFTISVYDLLGKEVWNQVVKAEVGSNQQEINLNSLKAGVYLLTILSKEGKQIIKITKD